MKWFTARNTVELKKQYKELARNTITILSGYKKQLQEIAKLMDKI